MSNSGEFSRRETLGFGLAAAAGLLADHPLAAAAEAGTLRAGITGFAVMNTLDPGKHSLIPESYVVWAIFNALLKFNEKMELVPDLAESFQVVDSTTLEFKLRPGVKFHDGSELSADDVKFTLDRVMDEKFGSPNPHRHSDSVAQSRYRDGQRGVRQEAGRDRRLQAQGMARE
jgi:peptide/nickel transport system substrate-binding protein